MKEEACRNSVHCNNTEFLHRAFLYFFCLCQVCCDLNNGTTGIPNDVCQSQRLFGRDVYIRSLKVAVGSLLSRYAFVRRQKERRDDSGLFHDPQIFFYKF